MKEFERKNTLEMIRVRDELNRRARKCFAYMVWWGAVSCVTFFIPRVGRKCRLKCLDGRTAWRLYGSGVTVLNQHEGMNPKWW